MTFLWLKSDLATPHVLLPHGKPPLDLLGKPYPQSLQTLYIQTLPLDQLHLEAKTHKALVKAGIVTIGDLFHTEISHLFELHGLYLDSLNHISDALAALNNAIREDGSINWFYYWETQGIQVIPSITASNDGIIETFNAIPQIAEDVLLRDWNKRSWIVIQQHLGLGNTKRATLEEIGNTYGLCRERVRQIERLALTILREVLVEQRYGGRNYHIHPAIHQTIQRLCDTVERESDNTILETSLLESISQELHPDPEKPNPSLLLLMALIGFQCLGVDYRSQEPTWGYTNPTRSQALERRAKILRAGSKNAWENKRAAVARAAALKSEKAVASEPARLKEKKQAARQPARRQKQPADEETRMQVKLHLFQPYLAFYQQIEEYAHSLLDAAPDKQMPIKDLLLHLHQQFEWPISMISHYFKVTGSIEQIDVPGAAKKMCRVKRIVEKE